MPDVNKPLPEKPLPPKPILKPSSGIKYPIKIPKPFQPSKKK